MELKLEGIELVRVEVPFVHDIGTAAGVFRMRPFLFVRVLVDGGEGWGECVALSGGTAVDPPLELIDDAVVARGVPRLLEATKARGGVLPSASAVSQLFGTAAADRQLAAVFEMGVWDAELRRAGVSMAQALDVGPGFEVMPVGAVVGIPPDRDLHTLLTEVNQAVGAGASRVRLKVEPGWELEPVRVVREAYADLVIQVDANGSFRLEPADIATLSRLEEFSVLCIEQPLPPADLIALAELAKVLPVPICLDESLSSVQRVRDALRNGACAFACLKPGRLGGVRATRAAHAMCQEAGIPAFVGGFFEAGLARASNLALAARLSQDAIGLVSDLGAPLSYLAEDPCGYPPVLDGWVRVPAAPGVGSHPDAGTLARLNAHRRWFPATYT